MTIQMNETEFLRAKISELEEEIRQLKDDLCPPDNPFVGKLGMSMQLACLLWTLYSTPGIATNERLNIVIVRYGQRESDDGSDHSLRTKVRITHLRHKLRKYGISINNVWAVGYRITDEDKAKLKQVMEI